MKVEYISKVSMAYEVRTLDGTLKYNSLKDALESAKLYTRDTGRVSYLYKCFGKTKRK